MNIFQILARTYLLARSKQLQHKRLPQSLRLIERVERYGPLDLTEATYKASTLVALHMLSEAAEVLRQSEKKSPCDGQDESYVRRYRDYLWAIIRGDPDSEAAYTEVRSLPASRVTRRLLP